MIRSTRSITLVLISTGLAALGFGLWDHDYATFSSTQPTTRTSSSNHSSRSSWYWSSGRSSSGGSSSFHSSGTSRGGFGSTGHAVSS